MRSHPVIENMYRQVCPEGSNREFLLIELRFSQWVNAPTH